MDEEPTPTRGGGDPYPEFVALSLEEAIDAAKRAQREYEALKAESTEAYKRLQHLKTRTVPKLMEDADCALFKTNAGNKMRIKDEIFVHTPADKTDDLKEWLNDRGHGALITEVVNGSTLKAFVSKAIKDNESYPDEIVKVTIIPTAVFC